MAQICLKESKIATIRLRGNSYQVQICKSRTIKTNSFKSKSIAIKYSQLHQNSILVLRRGFSVKRNSQVIIVEDVITTGKSSLECSKLVKENNADIVGYACIIDRSNGKSKIIELILKESISQMDLLHYSNLGEISWYLFAKRIVEISKNCRFADYE